MVVVAMVVVAVCRHFVVLGLKDDSYEFEVPAHVAWRIEYVTGGAVVDRTDVPNA